MVTEARILFITRRKLHLLLILDGTGTSDETSSSGGDETNLLTGRCSSGDGRWVTNMLRDGSSEVSARRCIRLT